MLKLEKITVKFGGLLAVNNVSIEVPPQSISAIIGPNGAGKTTLFNVATGVYPPSHGEVICTGTCLKEPLRPAVILSSLLVGGFSGLALMLGVNLTDLWQVSIENHYVYLEPFPWIAALRSIGTYLAEHPAWSLLPFFLGSCLGTLAWFSMWQRTRFSPEVTSKAGLTRTFQNIRLFPELTATENVLVAMDKRHTAGFWSAIFRLPAFFRDRRKLGQEAQDLLCFVGLAKHRETPATDLPYGLQRRLEIARALATQPKILLLDEPAAGMNPTESADLMALIQSIRDTGITVLFIEHDMKVVMGISDRVSVLNYGNKIAEGTPAEIQNNSRVIEAYLGKAKS